jgi:hypothetical protein
MLCRMRRGLLVLAVLLVAAGSALAAATDTEQHKFNAADQAAAKTAVVQKKDLSSTGWTGGAKSPDLTPPKPCANWNPKQSDLVLTGAAETVWKHAGLEIDSEAQVLQTTGMVKLDWQRTVTTPTAQTCLESQIKKELSGSATKFVSFKRVTFPKLGTYSRAYLTEFDATSNGQTVKIAIEDILIGTKRTEITLSTTTSAAAQPSIATADIGLAKALVARAKA